MKAYIAANGVPFSNISFTREVSPHNVGFVYLVQIATPKNILWEGIS